ncbi:hypothetical protein RSO68_14850 [Halomonas saccharevitans]|uniref:Secreted protein n=1 Tax=Halomonas saccharevitans TaxID=416872 RepID=A0ABU3NHU5_9GAMM|nr:hypothetical protein [Halomonas saccharevitans]MDT8880753.1 hypothetical protein [Halomonas saccharevitans]
MKLTTLTAILVISLGSVSASLAGDSTYLEERSARLHQGIADTSQAAGQQEMGTTSVSSARKHR